MTKKQSNSTTLYNLQYWSCYHGSNIRVKLSQHFSSKCTSTNLKLFSEFTMGAHTHKHTHTLPKSMHLKAFTIIGGGPYIHLRYQKKCS